MLPTQLCIHCEIGPSCYVTFNSPCKPFRHVNMIYFLLIAVRHLIRSLDRDFIHKHPNWSKWRRSCLLWTSPVGSIQDERFLNWQASALFTLEGDGSGMTSQPISSVDFMGLKKHAQTPGRNTTAHTCAPLEEGALTSSRSLPSLRKPDRWLRQIQHIYNATPAGSLQFVTWHCILSLLLWHVATWLATLHCLNVEVQKVIVQ